MRNKLWPKKKISWLFDVIGSGTTPPASNEMYYDSPDMAWLNTGDLTDSYIEKTSKYVSQQALDKFSALTVFPKDSLVMAMYGATIGKLGITKYETTTNQACCVFSKPRGVITKFIFYWLMGHRTEIINLSHGGGQPNISQGIIRNIRIAVPPVDLQSKIVTFVDKKFEETNQLINKKEKMIKLLEQQRQSIITEAVTKGLNPNEKMKDSGVEWIGEIPEHWALNKIKYCVNLLGEKAEEQTTLQYLGLENIESKTGRYIPTEDVDIDGSAIKFFKGNVLFGKLRPYLTKVLLAEFNGRCSTEILVLETLSSIINNAYLKSLLLTPNFIDEINSSTYGSKMPRANWSFIGNTLIPLPPLSEQEVIVKEIMEVDERYFILISKLKNQIEKLKEYRQALIYEAVTGKIDVRDMELDEVR